jgi:hypothetical protein
MKTVRVTRLFHPGNLHDEIKAAGIPVVTVRACSADVGGPAVCGVVVLEDKADFKKTQSLIQAHQETRKPSRQPDPKLVESALREMEKL